MKVGYRTWLGDISTAYLKHPNSEDESIYTGYDKYTEEEVTVRWTGETWVEVPS